MTALIPHDWPAWSRTAIELAIAAAIGVPIHLFLSRVLRRVLARTPWSVFDIIFDRIRRPAALAWPLIMMLLQRSRVEAAVEPERSLPLLTRVLEILVIVALTWTAAAVIGALDLDLRSGLLL
jgi:hypothetical protein